MRKEKKLEDTDVLSYAAGMMGTVDMEANCQRAKALLRTVRTFHLTREETVDLIKNLKRKEMLPQSFYFNGSRVWSDWEDE